jgi:hypothetical protein
MEDVDLNSPVVEYAQEKERMPKLIAPILVKMVTVLKRDGGMSQRCSDELTKSLAGGSWELSPNLWNQLDECWGRVEVTRAESTQLSPPETPTTTSTSCKRTGKAVRKATRILNGQGRGDVSPQVLRNVLKELRSASPGQENQAAPGIADMNQKIVRLEKELGMQLQKIDEQLQLAMAKHPS